jgi:streptomycin 6-kinase
LSLERGFKNYGPLVQERIPDPVKAFLGERARDWPGLTNRLVEVVNAWDLRVTGLLEGGWNSLVVLATADEGVVVLKLAAQPVDLAREASALTSWGDEIAPRVLRHDDRLGAMLMERLEPGTSFEWSSADDTAALVPLIGRIHKPLVGQRLQMPLLSELGDAELQTMLEHAQHKHHLIDADSMSMAFRLLHRLFGPTDATEHVLLHGDAVPPNVLWGRNGLGVIDPRPCLGDAAYDAGYWSVFSGYGADARSNAALLARELRLDEARVLAWAWGLAVNRLLQIIDSTYPAHASLCDQLRQFIAQTRAEVSDFGR